MSDRTSSPGFFDLSDPNDPFYVDLYDSDSSDTRVEADYVTQFDRAVVDALDSSDGADLTFERIGQAAYEGFTLDEARAIAANPDQLAHLRVLWQLRPPSAQIAANSVPDDPSGHWHRRLERQAQQPRSPASRLEPPKPRSAKPRRAARGRAWGTVLVAASVAAAVLAAVLVGVGLSRRPTDISGFPTPANSAAVPVSPLPKSAPLELDRFVVPWDADGRMQLYLASVTGGIDPRRLAGPPNHDLFGASISADRRSLIYIDSTSQEVRTMATDGTGDRPLFDRLPAGCDAPGHVSLSPADENILVLQCNPKSGPTRLMVMTIEGDLVRTLPTGHVSVDDPSISPDGRTVAYWASDATTGPTGGSIYTVGIEDTSAPVALTDRPAGSDADPAWSPDGQSILFRRSGPDGNWDIYRMGSDGSNAQPFVTGPSRDHKPTWSPDGRQLMMISNRHAKVQSKTSFDLYLLNADGTGIKPLGFTGHEMLTPAWWHR
jgi:TolB protein